MRHHLAALAASFLAAAPLLAQSLATPSPSASDDTVKDHAADLMSYRPSWTLSVEPQAWWMSPGGDLRLPGSGGGGSDTVRVERLNLDTPRFAPAGSVLLRTDPWLFSLFGAAYSLDRDNTTGDASFRIGDVDVRPGDPLRTSFDFSLFEAVVGYMVYQHDFLYGRDREGRPNTARPENGVDALLSLYVVGGARAYDFDIEVERRPFGNLAGATSSTNQLFIEPIVGLRSELDLAHDFTIRLQVTAGGMGDSDRSSASIDVGLDFQWRPVDNVAVRIGWRQLAYWLDDGDNAREFKYDGTMAGLFFGVVVQF